MTKLLTIVAVLTAALLIPAGAQANTLLTVDQVDGHPTATWSLYSEPGSSETSAAIAIATNPATGSDGYFFSENIVAFDVLNGADTSYTDSYQIAPGTYYVRVLTFNATFYTGSYAHWSNILQLVIPALPVVVPPVVVPVSPPAVAAPVTPPAPTIIKTSLGVKFTVAGKLIWIRPSTVSRVRYVLSRAGYRKTLTTKGNVTLKHLKAGRYTLTAQQLGEILGSITYIASPVVVKHFTIKP